MVLHMDVGNDPPLSIVRGVTDPPLLDVTIGAALDAITARLPEHEALVVPYQSIRWTWGEFTARVDAIACGFIAQGLKPGDRVGIWAANCAEWAVVQFAAAKAGLILVTINPAYRESEVEYAINKVECVALVTASNFKTSNYIAMLRKLGRRRLPHLRLMVSLGDKKHTGFFPFSELSAPVDRGALANIEHDLSPIDPVNIQFTSGTTGFPKGATLTHHNILNNGRFVGARIKLGPADRMCIPVPLYHCFGMVAGNLASVTSGATMVYPGESFDPVAVLKTIELERCTSLYGVPTMFIAILDHPEFARFDLSSLRTGIMAGSPCPEATMREVIDRMKMSEITIAYGMTETSPVSFQGDVDDSIIKRVASVGRIQPHLEVKVVGEDGGIVPRGEAGELCVRGYSVMKDYWADPERTTEAIDSGGWMHTGDIGTLDEQGYCTITGRIKDMIIRGGENIYPREIEDFLMAHPAIADAQVFGVPDNKYGEEVCAWIMLKSGKELQDGDIRHYCKGRIAHYKIPRHIRFVTEFPMTVTGKIQKFSMRDAEVAWQNCTG